MALTYEGTVVLRCDTVDEGDQALTYLEGLVGTEPITAVNRDDPLTITVSIQAAWAITAPGA